MHYSCRSRECQERGTQWNSSPAHPGAGNIRVALTCQLQGLPYPRGSSWDLTCTQALEGFSRQDKWQDRRKCLIPSPRQQGAGMRQMSSFGSSVASGRGKHAGNHNSCKGTKGPSPASTGRLRDRHMLGPQGPCPAASKLMVPSKHPPRHTECLCERAMAQHPQTASPLVPNTAVLRALVHWAAPPGGLQSAQHPSGSLECLHFGGWSLATGKPLWDIGWAQHTEHLLQPQTSLSPLERAMGSRGKSSPGRGKQEGHWRTGTWQGCSASQGHRRFAKGYWV